MRKLFIVATLILGLVATSRSNASGTPPPLRDSDITAYLQAALDACPAFGCAIRLPSGSYFLTGGVLISKPVKIAGAGKEATLITYTPLTGVAFRTTPQLGRLAVGFSDLRIRTDASISATAFLMAYVEPATFTNVWIDGFVGGIQLTGNGTNDQSVGVWITNARIENVHGGRAFAVSMDHVADVYIDSMQMYSTIDDMTTNDIVIDRGAQGIYISHSITIGGRHNLVIRDTAQGGDYGILPSAISCESTYFDSATGGSAVVFDSSLKTAPVRAMFANCWAGGAGLRQSGAVATPGAAGVEIWGGSDIQWIGGVIRRNASSGVQVAGSLPMDLLEINGARIIANNAGDSPGVAGILVANPKAMHISIVGNTIGNFVDELGHQRYGISFPNGANPTWTVAVNTIDKNEIAAVDYGPSCALALCPALGR